MIQIKRNNKVFFTLEDFGEGSKLSYQLMDHHYVILKFTTATPIYFEIGDSVEIPDFGYFELTSSYFPKHNDSDGYDYEMQMDAYYMSWKNKICKYRPQHGANETSFKLTTTVGVHMNVILGNLKALGLTYNGKEFSVDYTTYNNKAFDVQKRFLIEYGSISILDALNSICSEDALNCEWWIDGSIIYLGYCEMEGQTTFEQNVNVLSMSYSESKSTYITRLYAFGSDRNIPKGYFTGADADVTTDGVATDYLMLPNKEVDSDGFYAKDGYLENVNVVKNDKQAIEGVVMFEEEYPKVESVVSSIKTYDSTVDNEDGTKTTQTFWQVTSTDSFTNNFKESWIKSNLTLGIKFTSGALMGMEFDVSFKVIDKVNYFEIVANDTYGRTLPDGVMCPKIGDKYFLFNWDATKTTDTDLIPTAQLSLFDRAKQYYQKTMISNSNFTCTMDGDKFYNDGTYDYHPLGEQVKLINDMFAQVDADGKHYRNSRIIGMEIPLDIPYDHPQYTVGEKAATSRLGKLEDKVDSIKVNGMQIGGTGSGKGGVYVIGLNDSTPASDSNVYSARRSRMEFVSRLQDNTAKGTITWEKIQKLLSGLVVGNSNNENGGSWTPDTEGRSHLITDYLEVRMKAIFEELVVKKTSTIGGKEIISPAGGVVAHKVEEVTVTYNNVSQKAYRCYFLAEQDGDEVDNDFAVNDQVRSESFNVRKGTYHKVGNHFYWRLVIGRDEDPVELEGKKYHYIDLSDTDCATASDVPAKGDVLSQCGNRTDVERQNCLIFSAVDTYSPSISLYHGINSYSFANKEYVEYGVNKQTNKAFFNVYGDMYVGDRPTKENGYEGSSYIKYDSAAKQVSVKGKISAKSTVDGKELSQYIKENSAKGLTEEQVNNLIKNSQVIADLQNQVDGAIETWFYEGVPTLKNAPASSWTTDKEKDTHLGDLYYDNKTGKAYRFAKDGSTYKWTVITDTDIAKALSDAAKAQETADGKMKVFSTQPIPPYQLGDIWVNATYPTDGSIYKNEILRCQTAKAKGSSFAIADWTKASKYTDDSALNTFKEEYKNDMASYKEQLDEKVETWFYNYAPTTQNKPASDWTTDTLKSQHAGDLFYNTSKGYTYRWTGTAWARIKDNDINTAMTAASKAQDTADGKRTVFTSQPTVPYDEGDLWASGGDDGKTLMVCIKGRTTGSFTSSEWVKANDSDLNAFAKTIEESLNGIRDQLDKKAETWYQPSDPSASWTTDDAKKEHKGDLWYNTSNNQTFFWNGTKWDKQDVPTEVFDKIDGKSSIYVSKPASYEERDLWILEAAYTLGGVAYSKGELVVATKSNASFSAADWTKKVKYTDDTVANAAKKAAEEAKKAAYTAQTNVTNLGKTVTSNKKAFDNYVTDGYLEPSEIAAMAQDSKRLEDAFAAAEKSYTEVKEAAVLKDTKELTDLNTAFVTLSTAKTELIKYLSDISARYNAANTEEKATIVSAVGTKFTNFQSAYSAFYDKLGLANAYITSKIYGDLKQNITDLAGYKYIKDALGQTTDIDGGLVMTTLLALRDADGNVQSGINGAIDQNRGKKSIATWWGGRMVDKDYNSGSLTPATSLIRFDGSGYLANGAIWWDVDGKVHADPTSFIISEKNLGAYLTFFEPTWKAGSAGTSVADLVSLKPNAPFSKLGVSGDATFEGAITFHGISITYDATNKAIKIDGNLYATGGITAYGAGTSTSGGGGLNASVISYARIIEGSYTDADLTSIPNAYAIKALSSRIDNISTELGGLSLSWNNITGKPSTFAPSAHTHKWADITDRITKVSQLTNDSGYTKNTGTVTSVSLTLPAGLTCATKTITTSGTFAISLASGYSIPTTAKQTAWDSAYDWYALMTTDEETADGIINKWNEVVSFLANIAQTDTLSGIVDGINKSISDEVARAKKAEGVNASGISANKGSIATLQGYFTNGSAKKALQLTNARKLWGNSFNGTADINGSIIVPSGKYISIGNIKLEYDAANKALKITNTTTEEVANLYTSGGVSAYGVGASSSSGGGLNGSVKAYSDAIRLTTENLSEIASAYSIKALDSRISSLEGGSATSIETTGSGNAVTSVSKSGTKITFTKGSTFSLNGHTHTFASLTSKPSSLSGYGITDGVNAVSVTGSGNAVTAASVSGHTLTLTKGSTFSLSNHTHYVGTTQVQGSSAEQALTGITKIDNILKLSKATVTVNTSYKAEQNRLVIYGNTYGNDANYIKSAGKLSYGDGGPQLVFSTSENPDASGVQSAALVYTDHDAIGVGVSLSFVTNQGDAYFIAPHIKALTAFQGNLAWSYITNKPTTLSGFGITDAYTKSQVDAIAAKYLPLTGGTLTGQLRIAASALNGAYNGLLIGDDCYIGDCNTSNTIGLMGVDNNNAGMVKFGKGGMKFGYNGSNHIASTTAQWTNLNADLLDGWHKDNIVWSGAVNSNTASLSHYWAKLFDITVTDNQYNDRSFTFLFSNGYNDTYSVVVLRIRQNGAKDSGAYNFSISLRELVGNMSSRLRVYYNNATGNVQLWGNCQVQYGSLSYTIIKKTGRASADFTSQGTLVTNSSFSAAQSLPATTGDSPYTLLDGATRIGIVKQADQLVTARSLWGQSFNGTANVSGNMTGVGNINTSAAPAGTIYTNNWFRSKGSTGWYSEDHGGGWYMSDNTWIRNYGGKDVYLSNKLSVNGNVGIGTTAPSHKLHVSGEIYTTTKVNINGIILEKDSNGDLKVNGNLYATGGISAYGTSSAGSGGGLNGSVKSYSDALKLTSESLSEIASAYSIKALASRISSLEGGSATSISVSGSGNAVTSVTKNGTTITVTKGATFLTAHQSLSAYMKTADAKSLFLYHTRENIVTDLDNFNTSGASHIYEMTDVTNTPTDNGWLQVMNWGSADANYGMLLANDYNINGSLYFRHKVAGKWKAWKTLIDSSNIANQSVKYATTAGTAKNPSALSWSGYSSGSYDGSAAKSISIPNNTNQLTNGAGFITASGSITGNAATATHASSANYIRNNGLPSPANNTVKAYKDSLVKFFKDFYPNGGVGANVIVSASIIRNWSNDSATFSPSSNYCFIKIGGAYGGAQYGQYMLSTYKLERVGIVGRNENEWTAIKWLAYTDDIPKNNNQLANGAGYITSAGSCKYATSAGNADTVDGYHATSGRTFNGNINWSSSWEDNWSDGTNTHPWHGFDHRYPNTGAYSTTLSDYFGMTIKTNNILRLDFRTLLLNGINIYNINVNGANTILGTSPQIAAPTEKNSIYVSSPSYSNNKPVKMLCFDWYGNYWAFSNIRSPDTNSAGFGVFFKNTEIARFTSDGNLSCNAASATKLKTARSIWGQSFDGTANVSGSITGVNNITMSNNSYLYGKNTGGTAIQLIAMASWNSVDIGRGALTYGYTTQVMGKTVALTASDDSGKNTKSVELSTAKLYSNVNIETEGGLLAHGGVTAYSSSDIRLKQDLRKLDYLGIIKAMGGTFSFAWKKDNTRSIGWIAQHVLCNPHLKDIVETDEKGYYKINYWSSKLIATAFGAIEQVGDEVSRLKTRVVFLESEVQRLSGKQDGSNKKRLDNKNINLLN